MAAADALHALAERLGAVNERVGVAARNVAGALLVVMTVVVMAQVVSRYIFNSSLSWTEELSKVLMVWAAFLVAPWSYRHGANVAIEMFADALPITLRRLIELVITILVLWIVAVLFRESLGFVARGMQSRAASLPVSTGVFYLITPVAFAALFFTGVELALRQLAGLAGRPDPVEDQVSPGILKPPPPVREGR